MFFYSLGVFLGLCKLHNFKKETKYLLRFLIIYYLLFKFTKMQPLYHSVKKICMSFAFIGLFRHRKCKPHFRIDIILILCHNHLLFRKRNHGNNHICRHIVHMIHQIQHVLFYRFQMLFLYILQWRSYLFQLCF